MKKWVLLGIVAIVLLGAAYAFAQGPGFRPGPVRSEGPCWQAGGPERGPGPGGGRWASLTPEQRTKFQELRRKFAVDTAQLRGNLVAKRTELHALWSDPKADSKVILEKEREVRDLRSQMWDKAVQMRLEARNLLTPEQLQEFGAGWGMGPGFGRGPGSGGRGGQGPGPRWGCGQGPCS